MSKTRVFISSTCFDLSQIRKDLKDGIESMGHTAILSENQDFPVNPSLNSAENCIEAVRNEADIFVLIIGGRYGYKLDSGKSITNTEFLTALQKGIPIYTFTLKNVIHILPVWKKNPLADFSTVVDDNKVFEFICDVREKNGIWNFEFESAQDILEILKSQWSILLQQVLDNNNKLQSIDNSLTSKISSRAIKILLDKESSYEILVYMQMMKDEIEKYEYLKRDCDYSIVIKPGAFISDPNSFAVWQQEKIGQIEKVIESLNHLFSAVNYYYGEPGIPSDIEGLYYVAHRYGELYASLLDWIIDVRSTNAPETYNNVIQILSELPLKAVEQLKAYPEESMIIIRETESNIAAGLLEKGTSVDLTLHLSVDNSVLERIHDEMDKLQDTFLN